MAVRTVDSGTRDRYAGARSVVKIEREADGSVTRTILSDEGKKRRRKVSRPLRRLDRSLRKITKAENVASSDYLRRHERSNRKKKNGALKDLRKNLRKSVREGIDTY
jgi:hypothetical protein